jgi:hypothetical protein
MTAEGATTPRAELEGAERRGTDCRVTHSVAVLEVSGRTAVGRSKRRSVGGLGQGTQRLAAVVGRNRIRGRLVRFRSRGRWAKGVGRRGLATAAGHQRNH